MAYLLNTDTIKRLGWDNGADKWVWFTYKRVGPTKVEETKEVGDVKLDHSQDVRKPPSRPFPPPTFTRRYHHS